MAQYCLKCGSLCEPGARYCMACGAVLTRICPNCGTTLDMQAIFCMNCGTKVPMQDFAPEPPAEQPVQRQGNPPQQTAPTQHTGSSEDIEYEDAKVFFHNHMKPPVNTQVKTAPVITEPTQTQPQMQKPEPAPEARPQDAPLPEAEEADGVESQVEPEPKKKKEYDEADVLEEDEDYVYEGQPRKEKKVDPLSFLRKHRPGETSEQHDEDSLASRIKSFNKVANADGYYNDKKPLDFAETSKEHSGLDKELVKKNALMILGVIVAAAVIIFIQMHS